MAGWLSTYGANAVLDGTAIPATLYGKLHIGNPTAAGTSNAATETTRKSFTRATSSGGATSNAADMTWTSIAGSQDATFLTGLSGIYPSTSMSICLCVCRDGKSDHTDYRYN